MANRSFHGKVGRVKGGIMVLEAVGFKRNNNKDTILLDNIDENKNLASYEKIKCRSRCIKCTSTNRPIVPTEMDIRSASSNSNNNNNDNNASKNDQDEFVVVDEKRCTTNIY